MNALWFTIAWIGSAFLFQKRFTPLELLGIRKALKSGRRKKKKK